MDGQSISLEPAGQLELSGAPLLNLHQTCAEVNSHLYQVPWRIVISSQTSAVHQVKTITEDMNVIFVGIGYDPITKFEEIPTMPKER